MQKTINQTENGQIFKCSTCNKIHVEFNNLNFNFSEEEYEYFADYVMKLNGEEWEYKNRNSTYKRKIIVRIGHKNLNILLNNSELQELKNLFNITDKTITYVYKINTENINITQFLN